MNKKFLICLPFIFLSCVQSSLSLKFDPKHSGIPINDFAALDSVKTVFLGSYLRKSECVASIYNINGHYSLLIAKLQKASSFPQILATSGAMATPGRYSTITQQFYDFNISDEAVSIQTADQIKVLSDGSIHRSKAGEQVYFASFKKLVLEFNADPSAIITMTAVPNKANDQVELKFVRHNDRLYLMVLSSNDANWHVRSGMLQQMLDGRDLSSQKRPL